VYRHLAEANKDIADYLVGYYNQVRPHTFNGGVSPVAAKDKLKILSGIS
jgi:putative transposase